MSDCQSCGREVTKCDGTPVCGLMYIASSPPQEHGGFHLMTVQIAKDALAEIARLRSDKERLEKALRWIPVEESLPPFGILVLVTNLAWRPGWPQVMHGHLNSEGEWCGHYADLERCGQPTEKGLPADEPTHWMRLPSPPEARASLSSPPKENNV